LVLLQKYNTMHGPMNVKNKCIEFSGSTAAEQKSKLLRIEKYYRLNRAETPSKSKTKQLRVRIPTN